MDITQSPKIIKGVEALIEKIQAVIKVLQEWYNKVVSWFTNFNATLTQKLQELNLISFEGDKKAIEGEVNTSNTALDNIIQDIEDGIDRLKNWTKETFGPKFNTTKTTEPSPVSKGWEEGEIIALVHLNLLIRTWEVNHKVCLNL